jgi:hypothetical protein
MAMFVPLMPIASIAVLAIAAAAVVPVSRRSEFAVIVEPDLFIRSRPIPHGQVVIAITVSFCPSFLAAFLFVLAAGKERRT